MSFDERPSLAGTRFSQSGIDENSVAIEEYIATLVKREMEKLHQQFLNRVCGCT